MTVQYIAIYVGVNLHFGARRYIDKHVSLLSVLCGVQHSLIIAHFLMPETQQFIILIIYSNYLKDLLEL